MTLDIARKVLSIEAKAIEAIKGRLNGDFLSIVDLLFNCKGRVIVVGLGKSGIIGSKFAASLASTGTPSFFLHASEAVHGGLGLLAPEDVLVGVSYSGEQMEFHDIMKHAKRLGIKIVALTGSAKSTLAKESDFVFDINVDSEASTTIPFLPTTSTTVLLALSDAITVTLLEKRGFYESDFAKIHPGGAIGKRLTRINDLMHVGGEIPLVQRNSKLPEVMREITDKNFGLTGVVDGERLVGVITDADIRRTLVKKPKIEDMIAEEIMSNEPKVIFEGDIAEKAISLFEKHTITSLFVVGKDNKDKVVGYVHLKDFIRAKII